MEEHKVISGIEKEYTLTPTPFIIGQNVLYEVSYDIYELTTIINIVFKTFTIENILGKNVENYNYKAFFAKDEVIDVKAVYSLKTWVPTYILANGKEVDYNYKLKKLKTNL